MRRRVIIGCPASLRARAALARACPVPAGIRAKTIKTITTTA